MRHTADTPHDTSPDISRYTVPEASHALGISPEAVRNRLSRGTLDSVREDGSVFVLLTTDQVRYTTDRPRHADGTPNDEPRYASDISGDTSEEPGALIASKDETIRVLLEQLEAERTASAELRRIVAGLVQRVPELESAREASSEPSEPREAPEPVSGGAAGNGDDATGSQEPTHPRSWLYRFFFGP